MTAKMMPRAEALRLYGSAFVAGAFKDGQREIRMTEAQQIAAHKWRLLMDRRFLPFAYDYVYIVGAGDACKVGFSVSPKQRLGSLQTGIAEDLEIVGLFVFRGGAGQKFERAAHRKLKAERLHIRGEWFRNDRIASRLRELAEAKYSDSLLDLEAAWKGSEEMMRVALHLHKDDRPMQDRINRGRDNFLWVASILRGFA